MTPPMTDDLVGRLRALREAANPGTWMQLVADNAELLAQMEEDAGKVDDRVAGLIYTREGGAHGKGVTLATINARRSTIERDQANALLIVEALEVENRKLRDGLEHIVSECGRMRNGTDDWFDLADMSMSARNFLFQEAPHAD